MTLSQFVDLSSPLRPTNAERLSVQDQIASLEPRLEDIQTQRKLALAHLSSLLVEKSLLEIEINRRKELLHPIKSLPAHLMTHIFEFDIEYWPKGIARLQLVSKEWYHLVKNSPTLW
ncbi:14914_t:CDS:1, partial [Acaulospora colombiana]